MNHQLSKLFIGSSSEGLEVAKIIQVGLETVCETTLWTQGVFGIGDATLESLIEASEKFDFAVLVLTPDDLSVSRDLTSNVPRDNVIFELGLFIGRIGRKRTFFVFDKSRPIRLPSDLAGINSVSYRLHQDGDIQSSTGAAVTLIETAVRKLGPLPRPVLTATPDHGTCSADWRVSEQRARKLGLDIKAEDASDLYFILLSVVDCSKSRIVIADFQVDSFRDVRIEATYDLMGTWDLLIKLRVKSRKIAGKFFDGIVKKLVDKILMDECESEAFGRRVLINVVAQSKDVEGLLYPKKDEIISYVLLPNNADYDTFRANRSFLYLQVIGKKGTLRRRGFLKELQQVISHGVGNVIIESICEGENEIVIETLSTCSQSNYISRLNREIETLLTIHKLQKYTLSCYYHNESGLLSNAKSVRKG